MQRWKPCQARLHPGEKLFAYLDDVWLVSQPERVGQVHNVAEHELDPPRSKCTEGRLMSGTGQGGNLPAVTRCKGQQKQRIPMPESGEVPSSPRPNRALKYWGCPLGHEDFVSAQLEATTRNHQALLQAIPTVPDVQFAWSLLLHCAAARANYRVLRPDVVSSFARAHDAGVCSVCAPC